ncbi:ROK family transcriptional regulator [Demequina capsici]|uniref:ROK family transcriptional regulator n=1 Tax=Demequina capsici TaxID=3075620 RepID=A0AA96FCP9_9MICO|nr:ROK family transcriptional regulator [Demequina sp. PMTSA13]WNM27229.1 ROK family transcriptional regulator [Demequina sp. PMTSA13]
MSQRTGAKSPSFSEGVDAITRRLVAAMRDGSQLTITDLARALDLSRTTVGARVRDLTEQGVLVAREAPSSSPGRPSTRYSLRLDDALLVAVDLGARHGRVAIADLTGAIIDARALAADLTEGPERGVGIVIAEIDALLAENGRTRREIAAACIGLPGPVEHETGRPVSPPIMPGWNGYDVAGHVGHELGAPVLVDNDVNIMAVGEHTTAWRDVDNLLLVKAATGIGAGVIADGILVRGDHGSAGDIGHMQVPRAEGTACRCGQTGCVEAIAGAPAIARDLGVTHLHPLPHVAIAESAARGDAETARRLRDAGRALGEVIAVAVSVLNPEVVVIGGELARASDSLLAGIRETVHARSTGVASTSLQIVPSRVRELAGVIGAARLAQELVLGLAPAPAYLVRTPSTF